MKNHQLRSKMGRNDRASGKRRVDGNFMSGCEWTGNFGFF